MNKFVRYNEINWSMPFLFTNMAMLKLIYEIVGANHTIRYIYGTPRCKWAGGRLSKLKTDNILLIEKIIEKCISFETIPVFTFSNTSLTKEDINDAFSNELLKIIEQYNCQVIIANKLLHNYIKDKYPDIKQVCSIINWGYEENKKKDELELINFYTQEYDRVVIKPETAVDKPEILKGIKNIEKIELLVNQNCAKNCPNSLKHYKIIEKQIWSKETEQEALEKIVGEICPRRDGSSYISNTLTVEQVDSCIKSGIKNLKLQGRTFGFDKMLNELLYYFFSPEIDISEINKFIDYQSKNDQKLQIKKLFK